MKPQANATSAPSKKQLLASATSAPHARPATGTTTWAAAVSECRAIVERNVNGWRRICELAAAVVTEYGNRTQAKFAEAIGVKPATLKRQLSTYRAWKPIGGPAPQSSWGVMQVFEADPEYGAEMLKAKPDLKKSEARALMKAKKGNGAAAPPEPEERWEQGQRKSFSKLVAAAATAISFTAFVYRGGLKPDKERTLAAIVRTMPTLLEDIKRAAEGLLKLYDYLQALLKKYPAPSRPAVGNGKDNSHKLRSRPRTDQPQAGAVS
jgi:hypothetical protein